MSDYAGFSAMLVLVAGLLTCFWGYRLVKVSLGIIGFVTGAFGGWELGLALANNHMGIALGCALGGGLVGMALCVGVYFLGIFLLGAAAGAVVAAACFNGVGQQIQPVVFLVLPVAFGVIALLVQKFMIILSTAFSGAYLVIAGIWTFVADSGDPSRIWLYPRQNGSLGNLGLGALVLWVLLALLGIATQFRASRKKVDAEVQKK
jgi:hypothetical protein